MNTIATTGRLIIWSSILLLVAAPLRPADATPVKVDYPPPPPVQNRDALGRGIQRTMTLLATSTPEHRNHVRVLFYGQSITEQEWSKMVAADLRKRFPNADLEIENRAIGGFASQLLIRPAEHDLYPFYPDLLIFHVYGANNTYEEIIKSVRSRTAAEVLMQLDHIAAKGFQEIPDEKADKGLWWDWMMNHKFLPDIAKKYGCGLNDIRTPWIEYLKSNHYQPKQLLKDGVHLNDQGNYLMAALTERYLVYRPELPQEEWKDLSETYAVGKDAQWKDGKLTLDFEGNRVDLIAPASPPAGVKLQVRIDGKKPSEFPGAYRITRPQPGPWSPLTVTRIDHEKPLVLEDWTLKITSADPEKKLWAYEVSGSVTGPDGAGSSAAVFTSNSGRVKISPADFFGQGKVQPGYTIKWKVLPMFVDLYEPTKIADAKENATTIAQGIPNEKHTLELSGNGDASNDSPITAVRVYCPPAH